MGLRFALDKTKNSMYTTFKDAYWAIDEVAYTTDIIKFSLKAYPSREAKLMNGQVLENPTIGIGSGDNIVNCCLYQWSVVTNITDIFPDGSIPAGKDAQYTAIYNWIKDYTKIPFDDILED